MTFARLASNFLRRAGSFSRAHPCAPSRPAQSFFDSLEPRQMMAADLMIEIGDTYAPLPFYVPGETINVPYSIRNNNTEPFTGVAKLSITLVSGFEGLDTLSVERNITANNLAADGTLTGTFAVRLPAGFTEGNYQITVSVLPFLSNGTTPDGELFAGDNSFRAENISVRWVAGNVPAEFSGQEGRNGVVLTLEDADGTPYTVSINGGGYASFESFEGPPAPQVTMIVNGLRTPTANVPQTIAIAALPVPAGSEADNFVDFDYDISSGGSIALGGIDAPALNFGGTLSSGFFEGFSFFETTSTTNITLRSIDVLGGISLGASSNGERSNVGAIRMVRLDGDLTISGNVGSLSILTAGAPTTLAMGPGSSIIIDGNVGAITLGTIGEFVSKGTPRINIGGNTGAITTGNISNAAIGISGRTPSFTARDVSNSNLGFNVAGNPFRAVIALSFGAITSTDIAAEAQISTFIASRWTSGLEGFSTSAGRLIVRALTTMNIGTVGSAVAANGDFAANVFILGGVARATQLGTVNINGRLTGHFVVGGNVGAFTARIVDTAAYLDPSLNDWAPALAASGTVLSFTSPDVRSGALWVNTVRTVNLTVRSNDRNFEVAAGLRLDRDSIADGSLMTALLGDVANDPSQGAAAFSSGLIGTLNLTLRAGTGAGTPVTGFAGRFIAAVNLIDSSTIRDANGILDFAGNPTFLYKSNSSVTSRINSIVVTGAGVNYLTANSLGFAFTTYAPARFNYGTLTAASGVLIPVAPNPPLSAAITFTPANAATTNVFFRVGLD